MKKGEGETGYLVVTIALSLFLIAMLLKPAFIPTGYVTLEEYEQELDLTKEFSTTGDYYVTSAPGLTSVEVSGSLLRIKGPPGNYLISVIDITNEGIQQKDLTFEIKAPAPIITTAETIQNSTKLQINQTINDSQGPVLKKIQDDENFETEFWNIKRTNKTIILEFSHNSTTPQPVWIDENVSAKLTTSISNTDEKVNLTITLTNETVPEFRLHIGVLSEIFQAGLPYAKLLSHTLNETNKSITLRTYGKSDLSINTPINATCGNRTYANALIILNYSCNNTTKITTNETSVTIGFGETELTITNTTKIIITTETEEEITEEPEKTIITLKENEILEAENENKEKEPVAKKTEDDPNFETYFVNVTKNAENLTLTFYHDSILTQAIWIEGNINYSLSNATSPAYNNITLRVPLINNTIPKFNLHIGPTSEIFSFGILISTNVTILQKIPLTRILSNNNATINLSNYFSNATKYSINVTNITATINGEMLIITPNGFKGVTKATITAYAYNNSINSNFTILSSSMQIKTTAYKIEIGKPVKWEKNVTVAIPENITIDLPKEAKNITVKKVKENTTLEANATIKTSSITGAFLGPPKITGWVVQNSTQNNSIQVVINDNSTQYQIEYYTDAPYSIEQNKTYSKTITIIGPDLNYTNVLSYTNIPEMLKTGQESQIRIYWKQNKTFINFSAYDLTGNGMLDYIEWITPHLSNQTFEIILITKAEHLNENRSFIEEIYDYVKERDNNWTQEINASHYVRVTFEKNLTSQNDITIYARSNHTNASILVHEKDSNITLAQFQKITNDTKYQIFLTNLSNKTQDVFDLEITGNPIEFDHIIDPGFSGGNQSAGETAYLVIWDENDIGMPNASKNQSTLKLQNDQVKFFADYKQSINGTKITNGACDINITNTVNSMSFNQSFGFYIFNRSFTQNGVFNYKINCSSSFPSLNTTDFISIANVTEKTGNISTIVGDTPFYTTDLNPQNCSIERAGDSCIISWQVNSTGTIGTTHTFFSIIDALTNTNFVTGAVSQNITLTITGNDTQAPTILSTTISPTSLKNGSNVTLFMTAEDNVQIDTCLANITLPDTTTQTVNNVCDTQQTFNNTQQTGTYNVIFFVNDTSGNIANTTGTFTTTANFLPNITSIILNATDHPLNTTNANLTLHLTATDADGDSIKNITTWFVNETSIMLVNMPFEGGSNNTFTKNYAPFSNGTVTGATFQSNTGFDGKGAYLFDLTDSISISLTNTYKDFTYVATINASLTDASFRAIIDVVNDAQWLGMKSGAYQLFGRCGNVQHGTVKVGEYHQIAWVVNGTEYTLYEDGVSIGTGTGCSASTTGTTIEIGSSSGENWRGHIDDVMIFNTSLTSEQILLLNASRTNIIHNTMTSVNETWSAQSTPNDGTEDGITRQSNNVTILSLPILFPNCQGGETTGNLTVTTQTQITQNISCDVINITSTGTLIVNSSAAGNTSININATIIEVQQAGNISADGTGFLGGEGINDNGHGPGASSGTGLDAGTGGAGHGGPGGKGDGGIAGGPEYDNIFTPVQPGSGAGTPPAAPNAGGAGGGAIHITTNTIILNGTISARGTAGTDNFANGPGGGSGGSILLNVTTIKGNGQVISTGGTGGDDTGGTSDGGGGGGGIISILFNTSTASLSLDVSGGQPGGTTAEQGITGAAMLFNKQTQEATITSGYRYRNTSRLTYSNLTITNAQIGVVNKTTINITQTLNATNATINITKDFTIQAQTLNLLQSSIKFNNNPRLTINATTLDDSNTAYTGKIFLSRETPNIGRIDWLSNLSNLFNLSKNTNISSNKAFANSTKLSGINVSANITFFSVTRTNPVPTVDFEDDGTFTDCPTTICTEISFTNNVFKYNVTGFTTYSEAETQVPPNITSIILNATDHPLNRTTANLTLHLNGTDDNGDSFKNITTWFVNGTSIQLLNMPFEGGSSNSTFTKDYALGNNGTISGATFNTTAGFDNKGAYDFNASGGITLNPDKLNDLDITIILRFKAPSEGNFPNLITRKSAISASNWFVHLDNAGRFKIRIDTNGGGNQLVASTTNVRDNKYHFGAIVLNDAEKTAQVYVDGILETTGAYTGNFNMSGGSLKIGEAISPTVNFNGTIDEVTIWNKTLSAQQIQAIFNNQTNLIVNNETQEGETWFAQVTPNDGTQDGTTKQSNNVTIASIPPSVFDLRPIQGSTFNKTQTINISANVTDDTAVDTVIANITFPDSTNQLLTLLQSTGNKYNNTFTIPGLTGQYNITIIANDTFNNINSTETTFFTSSNVVPEITQSILNTTDHPLNTTNANLTLHLTATDTDGDSIKNITTWFVNGTSIQLLNVPFEGGSNATFTKDYSSFGNNGTVVGATFNNTGGYDAFGAYEFDGGDSIKVDMSSGIFNVSVSDEYSVSSWVKTRGSGSAFQMVLILGGQRTGLRNNGAKLWGRVSLVNSTGSTTQTDVSGTAFDLNQSWHHVVYVMNYTTVTFYVDGVVDKTQDVSNDCAGGCTGLRAPLQNTLCIGSMGTTCVLNRINGTIDDLQFWNRSLNAQQVLALYNNRTDLIVSQETKGGEVWFAQSTPNDGTQDGLTVQSNNVTIIVPQLTITLEAIPTLQGYGENVTLQVNVTNNNTGVDTVLLNITRPTGEIRQRTASLVSGNTFEAKYNDFLNGTYNVTTTANLTDGTSKNATTNFTLEALVTTNIRTEKELYNRSEFVFLFEVPFINLSEVNYTIGVVGNFTIRPKVDIVWIIDRSGSMLPIQQDVADSIATFTDQLNQSGLDFQLAVTCFLGISTLQQTFTSDLTTFSNAVTACGSDGVIENGLDALTDPLTLLSGSFRSGAPKIFIIVSNEGADDYLTPPNDGARFFKITAPADTAKLASTQSTLITNNVTVFGIVDTTDVNTGVEVVEYLETFSATNGRNFERGGNFNQLMSQLGSVVSIAGGLQTPKRNGTAGFRQLTNVTNQTLEQIIQNDIDNNPNTQFPSDLFTNQSQNISRFFVRVISGVGKNSSGDNISIDPRLVETILIENITNNVVDPTNISSVRNSTVKFFYPNASFISRILNNDTNVNITGQLLLTVEQNTTTGFQHLFVVVNDTETSTLRTIQPEQELLLKEIWDPHAFHTGLNVSGGAAPGIYRARVRFFDVNGTTTMNDSNGVLMDATFNFRILGNKVQCGTDLEETTVLQDNAAGAGSGFCFNLTKTNVILECAGNSITAALASDKSGTAVLSKFTENTSVFNCTIDSWSTGIDFRRTNNSEIKNNLLLNNTEYGVILKASTNHTINNNTFLNQGKDAIAIDYHFENISGTVVPVNPRGTIIRNVIRNAARNGIEIFSWANEIIKENVIDKALRGIDVQVAGNLTIQQNTIENTTQGIRFTDNEMAGIKAQNNPPLYTMNSVVNINESLIENNTLKNTTFGIIIRGSSFNNTIANNTINITTTAILLEGGIGKTFNQSGTIRSDLFEVEDVLIINNTIQNGTQAILLIARNGSKILRATVTNNTILDFSTGINATFNDTTPIGSANYTPVPDGTRVTLTSILTNLVNSTNVNIYLQEATETTISNNTLQPDATSLFVQDAFNTTLKNNSIIPAFSIYDIATSGRINFTNTTSITNDTLLSSAITITNNNIRINSSQETFLNQSAKLTFRGLTGTPTAAIVAFDEKNFKTCQASICENYTFSTGTAEYDVIHFTNYSTGNPPNITTLGCSPPTILAGKNTTCGANITNTTTVQLDVIQATITLPNGSTRTLTNETTPNIINTTAITYLFNFSETTLTGTYTVTWFANLTDGLDITAQDSFNVNACGFINSDFTLATDTLSNGTCFTINASSIALNCAGFSITGNGSGTGILAPNTTGVTIRDCTILNFTDGIRGENASNGNFINNTLNGNLNHGLYILTGSNNNSITNNTAINNQGTAGFRLDGSSNNIIDENTAVNNTFHGFMFFSGSNNLTIKNNIANETVKTGVSGFGIRINSGDNITASNNTAINNSVHGIIVDNLATNITLIDNTALNNTEAGIDIASATEITLLNNLAENNSKYGIFIDKTAAENINVTRNTMRNNQVTDVLVKNANKITLNNNTLTTYNFTNARNLTIRKESTAIIDFLKNLTETGTNFDEDIQLFNNSIFINSTRRQGLNTSANLTFFNIGFSDPGPIADFEDDGSFLPCGNKCTRLSFQNNILIYNVTSFTNYSSAEGTPNITSIILNATDHPLNRTTANLTLFLEGTDANSDPFKNITTWFVNGTSIQALNMPFEGGSNATFTKDYSSFGNNGTPINTPTFNSTGGFDGKGAYEFNSANSEYLDLGSPTSLDFPTNDFTITAWIKPKTSSGTIVGRENPAASQGRYLFYLNINNRLQLRIFNVTGSSANVQSGTNAITLNEWNHVAATITRGEGATAYKLYVNGQETTYTTRNTEIGGSYSTQQKFLISAIRDGTTGFFNGTIDEVQVWNKSLSAQQIAALYNNHTDLIVSQETTKGETWFAQVTPNDGTQDGLTVQSNNVTIINNPPSVIDLHPIQGSTFNKTQTINISANVTDDTGLDAVLANITLPNGTIQLLTLIQSAGNKFNNTFTIPGLTGQYNITILANDTNNNINNTETTFFTAQNIPPNITSIILNATDHPLNRTTANLTLHLTATDNDGDSIKNITTWFVNGTSIQALNMPFEGGSNATFTKDYSSFSQDMTVVNATWNSTGGYDGFGSYKFSQNDTVDANSYMKHDIKNFRGQDKQGTITAWVKFDNCCGVGMYIFATDDSIGNNNYVRVQAVKVSGKKTFRFLQRNGELGTTGHDWFYSSTLNIQNNVWYHLAVISNDTEYFMYVNGVQQPLTHQYDTSRGDWFGDTNGTTGSTDRDNIVIGASFSSGQSFIGINGTIDDLRIYSVPLSQEQVMALYNNRTDLIVSNETTKGETWFAQVTPNDGTQDGLTVQSNNVTILGSPPTRPVQLLPPNDSTTFNRTPQFVWNNSIDADGDTINYTYLVDNDSDFSSPIINISDVVEGSGGNTSNISGAILDVDTNFFWKVIAKSDGQSNESFVFNFTVESLLAITLRTENVSFGNMSLGQNNDTTDNTPQPFVVENTGNVFANVSINGSSLFTTATFPGKAYQFKVSNNETGSINTTISTTSFTNMTNITGRIDIGRLNWTDTNDTARIDINITVPTKEPPGALNATVLYTASFGGEG